MAVEKINLRFDEDDLTIGDLEDFEDAVGVGLYDALKPVKQFDEDGEIVRDEKGRPVMGVNLTAKALKALVWIVLRSERPGFTLDDARNVKVAALEMVSDDPADAEGNDEAAEAPETPDESPAVNG